MVLVEVRNTSDKAFNKPHETTKTDGCHGYELEIVDNNVKKYDGNFVFKTCEKVETALFGSIIP